MPANIIHDEIAISGTPSSGTLAVNTPKLVSGLLRLIVIKAASTNTTFDVKIEDSKNNIVYQTEMPITGTLREQLAIPLKDVNTITIFNSSEDELFSGKIVSEE